MPTIVQIGFSSHLCQAAWTFYLGMVGSEPAKPAEDRSPRRQPGELSAFRFESPLRGRQNSWFLERILCQTLVPFCRPLTRARSIGSLLSPG